MFLDYLIVKPTKFYLNNGVEIYSYTNGHKRLEIEVCENDFHVSLYEEDETTSYYNCKLYEVVNYVKIFNFGHPKNSVLFTGAFNPPTIAHYNMIESASKHFDYIIFAISNQKFLEKKQNKIQDYSYSEQERLDMILEMTYNIPNVLIYGVEVGYTYNVLYATQNKFKINNLSFAMGSDKLEEINRWGYHDELLNNYGFYVLLRNDSQNIVKEKCERLFKEYIIGYDNDLYKNVSATKVRDCIKNKKDYSHLVEKNVYKYLKTNCAYS